MTSTSEAAAVRNNPAEFPTELSSPARISENVSHDPAGSEGFRGRVPPPRCL